MAGGSTHIEKEPQVEAFDVESDIARATHVPEHLINHNFPYDAAAYERVGKGLERLVRRGHLQMAMELSGHLMRGVVPGCHERRRTHDRGYCPLFGQATSSPPLKPRQSMIEKKQEWHAANEKGRDEVGFIWDAVRGRSR